MQRAWIKPGIWGAVIGSILTMIVGFSWGGWMTSNSGRQEAVRHGDAAVVAALLPTCLAREKADGARTTKLGELKGMTSSYQQTDFVMKSGWATFPGSDEPNRGVAEACAAALLKTAEVK
jgi:hypothetical protein